MFGYKKKTNEMGLKRMNKNKIQEHGLLPGSIVVEPDNDMLMTDVIKENRWILINISKRLCELEKRLDEIGVEIGGKGNI